MKRSSVYGWEGGKQENYDPRGLYLESRCTKKFIAPSQKVTDGNSRLPRKTCMLPIKSWAHPKINEAGELKIRMASGREVAFRFAYVYVSRAQWDALIYTNDRSNLPNRDPGHNFGLGL